MNILIITVLTVSLGIFAISEAYASNAIIPPIGGIPPAEPEAAPREFNSSPSGGGLNNQSLDDYTIIGADTCVFFNTASHLYFAECHAISNTVTVLYKGMSIGGIKIPGVIDDFESFGGTWFEIPFSIYHVENENGRVISIQSGNSYDLNGENAYYTEQDGDIIRFDHSRQAMNIYQEVFGEEPQYVQPVHPVWWR